LRLALNRLSEKGEWNLAELKIEFEELIVTNAPIEISGFSLEQIDQIILGDGADATDPAILAHLTDGGESSARLVLTDEPYNVPIAGNVTSGAHREFLMASGEMSAAAFFAFNSD
jgi:hypothetical protein